MKHTAVKCDNIPPLLLLPLLAPWRAVGRGSRGPRHSLCCAKLAVSAGDTRVEVEVEEGAGAMA